VQIDGLSGDLILNSGSGEADILDLVAYVTGSGYRKAVVNSLQDGPEQPSVIAEEADVARSHISRALSELSEKGIVQSHGEDSRTKLYSLTELGEAVADYVSED
jgi:predicted transcriptional regulator